MQWALKVAFSRFGWARCCDRLSRWEVLARGEFSRDEFSTSDDDHGGFLWATPFDERSRRSLFDGTLWIRDHVQFKVNSVKTNFVQLNFAVLFRVPEGGSHL